VSLSVRPDVHSTAEQAGLSGVITESRPGSRLVDAASRYASRALRVRGTMQTRFAMGNGSKGLAALARSSALLYLAIVFDHVTEAVQPAAPFIVNPGVRRSSPPWSTTGSGEVRHSVRHAIPSPRLCC